MSTIAPHNAVLGTTSPSSGYRTLWRWHFYAGLFVMPFLIVLAITGTLYCFQPQIEPLLYPRHLVVEPQTAPRMSEDALLARARAAMPSNAIAVTAAISNTPERSTAAATTWGSASAKPSSPASARSAVSALSCAARAAAPAGDHAILTTSRASGRGPAKRTTTSESVRAAHVSHAAAASGSSARIVSVRRAPCAARARPPLTAVPTRARKYLLKYRHHHSQRKPLAKSRSEKRPTLNVQNERNSLSQWPTRALAGANRRK